MGELRRPIDEQIKARQRADSWMNSLTGLGTALDRIRHMNHSSTTRDSFQHYEELLADDPLAYRIAHLPASEMMRQGFRLDFGNDAPTELKPQLMADFDRLEGSTHFIQALMLARGVGGSAIFIGADDGQDVSMPLNLKTLRKIRFLKVLSAQDINARAWYTDPNADKFGEAELFDVVVPAPDGGGQQQNLTVHETRLIRFDGIVTTDRRKAVNKGWGDSIFIQLEDRVADFWTAAQGLGNALSDADQAVFKLKGLNEIIKGTPEGEEAIRTKLSILQHGRSVARAVAVDADTEDFKYEGRTFAGYSDGLYALMHVVSMACGIPVTLLFGMSPGGLNATGDNDVRFFYDSIKGQQVLHVLPRLRRLFECIFAQREGPAKGKIPDPTEWSITFVALMQPSPVERADIRLKTSQADELDINNGIVTPGECAKSHFGGDEYCQDVTLDPDRDPDEPLETPADKAVAAAHNNAKALLAAKGGADESALPQNGK